MAYAGFDRADCPGLARMAQLKANSNLAFCGFYLPAPSQRGTTWKGTRAALAAQGWGLAPIFVGQQITGPGARNTTAAQGKIDGAAATKAMSDEGFAPGSFVYLDLENGPPFTLAQREYVGAWVDAVDGVVGPYRAGVYCSFLFAPQVAALRPRVRLWVFHIKGAAIAPHSVPGIVFAAPDPAASGVAGAVVWQHDDEARLAAFGDLSCDLDSSTLRDPGAPLTAKAPPAPVVVLPPPIPAPAPYAPPAPPDAPAAREPILTPGLSLSTRLAMLAAAIAAVGLGVWEYCR